MLINMADMYMNCYTNIITHNNDERQRDRYKNKQLSIDNINVAFRH